MNVVNVTNLQGIVRAYAIAKIQAAYPNIDLTENSAFDDVFLKPVVPLITPMFQKINSMEMMLNLENAEYMTEDELDEVGSGNYFVERKQGKKASTPLTLSFSNILEGETVVIPTGILFQTGEGIQFQTTERIAFTYSDMLQYYNLSTSCFDLPVNVEATGLGTEYNVAANTITTCMVIFNTNLVGVTNLAPVTNGVNKQSNKEYADEIKKFYISRHLGTIPGYRSFFLEQFEEVEDLYISGYGDEYMSRDIIKAWNPETSSYVDKHIGGAIDIHLKGCLYDTETVNIVLNTNMFLLSKNYETITAASVSVLNNTDNTKTPVVLSKTHYTVGGVSKMAVVLNNTGNQSFIPDVTTQICITYDYVEDSVTKNQADIFTVGHSAATLETPVTEVLSLNYLSGDPISNISNYYTLTKTGIANTTKEVAVLALNNLDSQPNGTVVTAQYVVNSTLKSIGAVLTKQEYRLATADVLAKEALPSYINLKMRIKMKIGYTLDKIKLAKIQSSVGEFFDSKTLGDNIEESAIVSYLTSDENVRDYIDYIALPFDAFYIAANSGDDLTSTRTGTILSVPVISYPVLNKINIVEII